MEIALKHVAVAACLLLASGSILATPVTNRTGIANPTYTITFSEVLPVSDGEEITNQYAAYGALFSPNVYFSIGVGRYPTDHVTNIPPPYGTPADPFVIAFSSIVSGAAFDFITNPGRTTFDALLNNVVVETFFSSTNLTTGTFYGFDGLNFDSIRVTIAATGLNHAMLMDNLQLRAVPEPGSMTLVALALAGLAYRKRRKV